MLFAHASMAAAQEPVLQDLTKPAVSAPDTPLPQSDEEIAFSADALNYDTDTQTVTASGNVQLLRQGNRLRADTVVWNRSTGSVVARGNVSVTDPDGNIGYGDQIDVTDSLKDGVVTNMLLVLDKGGRLAATRGQRVNNVYTLTHAAYSPCPVVDEDGCPKEPSWQIKAVKVIYRPDRQRVYYQGARLELFGIPIAVLPVFSHPVGGGGGTGFLMPDLRINGVNGLEATAPYYIKLAPNRDLTITPHVYTRVLPMMEASYRSLTSKGAYRVTGYLTYGSRIGSGATAQPQRDVRGYIEASGKFQLNPQWSITGALRRSTDTTFLRRYSITNDDRLRSTINAERIDTDSYLSIAGWSIQSLRAGDRPGQMPIALPVIDYRRRLVDPLLGGNVQLQLNTLAITRASGQDTQRAFVSAEWNLRRLTGLGQEITFTGFARGDVYHSSDNLLTAVADYRGQSGWQSRGIVAAAADARWPFIGSFLGGVQRITPRVQIVAAPRLANLSVPNEDSRSVDLEDSNLFALNRFAGYDRFEDSSRITFGVEYALDLNDFTLESVVGQSYRINRRATILPDGTGLSDRVSDIVGRTTVRYRDFVKVTHRYRLDKDSLAIRRNEIDAAVGSHQTYATIGYLRFNRNVTGRLEDLSDREEVRLGARVKIARYWSVFGSTIIDLTGKREDPLTTADGFDPVRHRAGIAYQNDCLDLSLTWRRDFQFVGDARPTNTFQLRLAFRNLGI
ncbi:LPS-assembly protein LptD [Sphingobium subterraneum]|nr:LPS assembly protein LptD [Sphingobium subterraneum]